MQYIPELTSLVSPGITPVHRDQNTINGHHMERLEAAYLDDDVTYGIYVPYRWRDGKVHGCYKGGTAETSPPNDDFTATKTDGGLITEGGAITTFADADANDQAYITLPVTWTGDPLIYLNPLCSVADGTRDVIVLIEDHEIKGKYVILDFGSAGTAGDLTVYGKTTGTYSLGSAAHKPLLIAWTDASLVVYLYDTMEVIMQVETARLSASSASPGSRVLVGCDSATGFGTLAIQGDPALVVMESR